MNLDENLVAELVRRSVVTETFRRLPPPKKSRIYEEAITLFGKYGYDGLSIDQICRRAGISKGSFFQYFPSKMHLLEFTIVIFDDYLGRWVEDVRRNESAVMARDRLLYLYQALVVNSKLYRSQQKFYLFATQALNHARVSVQGFDLERHFNDYVGDIISRAVETGEVRADYEVELTSYMVSLIMGALLNHEYRGKKLTYRETQEYLISFLFDGIKA